MLSQAKASDEGFGTEKYRRAGLTQAEATRYAQTLDMRDETRRLRQASIFGLLGWLIWKLIFKGFQPAWMIASILAAFAFGVLIIRDLGGLEVIASEPPDLDARIEAAFAAERGARDDVYGMWLDELNAAMDGDLRRRPDLDQFTIWAQAGPYFIGRERLALRLLSGTQTSEAVDARLRALPPEVRQRRLSDALAAPLERARAREISPVETAYAPQSLQLRFSSAERGWRLVAHPVETFLRGQAEGRLDIRRQPGLSRRQAGDVLLYDGIRHLVIQHCQSPSMRRAAASACPQDLPRQGFDPFLYGLAVFESGMIARDDTTLDAQQGARLIRAAYAAGRLSPAYEAQLRDVFARILPPSRIVEDLSAAGFDPEEAFQIPARYRTRLSGQIALDNEVMIALARELNAIAALQAASSASLSLRLIETLESASQLPALQVIVDHMGAGAVALYSVAGAGMFEIVEISEPELTPQTRNIQGLSLALLSALIVLLLSLKRIMTAPLIRQASRLQSLDARISRLLLGRKV